MTPISIFSALLATSRTGMEFLDCHHHFYDTRHNDFQGFLGRFHPDKAYLPGDYHRDVVESIEQSEILQKKTLHHVGSVHVEAMPDDGVKEVQWVESMESTVQAIVASCNLAEDDVDQKLKELKEASPKVKGIRWILDCVRDDISGELLFPATHVGNLRHEGVDYLRCAAFEKGFALLEKYDLSFDLQCAPHQLPVAAELASKYPGIPLVVDHLGKPMQLLGENNSQMMPDEGKIEEWKTGMKRMAALPHVYVKISGLGWAIPAWIRSARRVDMIRRLCQETVEMFGPERCMINTNWWKDAASSDSDGLSDVGPTASEYLEYMLEFCSGLTLEEQKWLFSGTAKTFYRI